MPNFNYTAGASFRPYTFEEMLRPLAMYTQEYNAIQEGIGELDTKAAIWENLANQQTDERTYKRYKEYANQLSAQADALAKNGLTPSSRKALLDLKRSYTAQIVPIEQAFAARAEEAKSQYAGRANGLVYEGDAATSSLDRYLDNPSIRYNYANSQEGFKRVATAASALAKGLRDYGNGKKLDNYTKTWLQEHGYTGTEISSAISDIRKIMNGDTNIQSNGVLRAILNDEMKTSGVSSWSDRAAVNDYFNRVAPALYQAVGQTNIAPYEDYGSRLQGQLNLARAKKGLTTKQSSLKVPDVTSYYFPKDRKKIPEILDEEGKLKKTVVNYGLSSQYDLIPEIFKDGKFTKPSWEGPYNSKSANAIEYYKIINNILLDSGFSQEVIDTMDKSTVENNLRAIRDENINDVIGRDVYRFSLDSEATSHLFSKLKDRGHKVKEITSMRNMTPQFGGEEELVHNEGVTADILYDPKSKLTSIQTGGKYYKMPSGMISNIFYKTMEEYILPETQQKIKDSKDIQSALLNKLNDYGELTPQELLLLEQTNNYLEYWGGAFNDIGNKFVEYTGKKNTNTNSN